MTPPYVLAPAAVNDMLDIFSYIAEDNWTAAEALEADLYEAFERLAANPQLGHTRSDLTSEPCLFWPVRRRYVVIYENAPPLTILRVINTYRDISAVLGF